MTSGVLLIIIVMSYPPLRHTQRSPWNTFCAPSGTSPGSAMYLWQQYFSFFLADGIRLCTRCFYLDLRASVGSWCVGWWGVQARWRAPHWDTNVSPMHYPLLGTTWQSRLSGFLSRSDLVWPVFTDLTGDFTHDKTVEGTWSLSSADSSGMPVTGPQPTGSELGIPHKSGGRIQVEELFVGMDWAPTNASGSSLLPMWQRTPTHSPDIDCFRASPPWWNNKSSYSCPQQKDTAEPPSEPPK